jgi:MutS domain V
MMVRLLHRDRDPRFPPVLRDAVLEAMVGETTLNAAAVERARRAAAAERSRGADGAEAPHEVLEQDLDLATLWGAMAGGDEFVLEASRRVVLTSLDDPDAIRYRQAALEDCRANPELARALYGLAGRAIDNERSAGGLWRTAGADAVLARSVQVLSRQVAVLRALRELAERHARRVRSDAFRRFVAMAVDELDDAYLATVEGQLAALRFDRGLTETATLGPGLKAAGYTIRAQPPASWPERLRLRRGRGRRFTIPPRDESGFRALADLRGRSVNQVGGVVARSADHVRGFFTLLRLEAGFYVGALNLQDRLEAIGAPTSLPEPCPAGEPTLDATGLYDVGLALHVGRPLVGNDLPAAGDPLIVMTGANQGGKSTLLRGLGIAQLMMQAGLFVGATGMRAEVRAGVHTHFAREEDARMRGGRLDEELRRMADIADVISPGALLLLNESFSSTNEREGSEIAGGVIRAMLDRGVRVAVVTHMFDLARGFASDRGDGVLFLRAERLPDGRRTFALTPGEPLPTSYARDSYRRVFGEDPPAWTGPGAPAVGERGR